MYFPSIGTNLYRICDEDGNLVKFLKFRDVNCILVDTLEGLPKDTRFAVYLEIDNEFKDNEYMEFVIIDENELTVYNNNIKVPVEKIDEYNIIHIVSSGLVVII